MVLYIRIAMFGTFLLNCLSHLLSTMEKGLLKHFLLMDKTSPRQVTWGSLCKPHFEMRFPNLVHRAQTH